jgi:hypothetical protein
MRKYIPMPLVFTCVIYILPSMYEITFHNDTKMAIWSLYLGVVPQVTKNSKYVTKKQVYLLISIKNSVCMLVFYIIVSNFTYAVEWNINTLNTGYVMPENYYIFLFYMHGYLNIKQLFKWVGQSLFVNRLLYLWNTKINIIFYCTHILRNACNYPTAQISINPKIFR